MTADVRVGFCALSVSSLKLPLTPALSHPMGEGLTSATERSINGTGGKVRYGDKVVELELKPGKEKTLWPSF